MNIKEISQTVIGRLPRYYRYLGELQKSGIERISSGALSKKMNVTASQIRQDLNNFGGFGQQGYGYNVAYLRSEIGKILGLDTEHNMIVMGAGNLGQALAKYSSFERSSFFVRGIFDNDPKHQGRTVRGIPVMMMDELEGFLSNNQIDIAALTIPKEAVSEVVERLVKNGVKAFLNFALVDLELPKDVIVENVHMSDSLMRLSYNMIQRKEN
ncbi:MAG: redox-sensing transcriptional repressor Rex [Lachnospiraceae bacterium]|nr:redox-sensing transcriptional repressor Rex [Lachnospiraceae bacterium]